MTSPFGAPPAPVAAELTVTLTTASLPIWMRTLLRENVWSL